MCDTDELVKQAGILEADKGARVPDCWCLCCSGRLCLHLQIYKLKLHQTVPSSKKRLRNPLSNNPHLNQAGEKIPPKKKTLWEREKMLLVTIIFSFSNKVLFFSNEVFYSIIIMYN